MAGYKGGVDKRDLVFWDHGLSFLEEGLLARDGLHLTRTGKTVCPEHEELHWEGFNLNWKWEGDASIELRVDEALHTIIRMDQTDQKGNNNNINNNNHNNNQ